MGGRLSPAVADVRRAVRLDCADLVAGSRLIVACSGGADSLALAAAGVFEGQAAGWSVGAAVVDHALQAGSDRVARDVVARLATLGCEPVDLLLVAVGGAGGPEAAARAARYAALDRLAVERDAIVLLGHTQDDQAETVLLGLARGSGLRSLSGMPSRRDRFRRPFLGTRRAVTQRACEALGLDAWQDPHNVDRRYTRARVRHEVLPLLERELGPGIAEALARTADLARLDADALDALAGLLYGSAVLAPGRLSVEVLADALPAVRRRVLRLAAVAAGAPAGDVTAHHVDEADRLLTHWHGQLGIDLPGRVSAHRGDGELRFVQAPTGHQPGTKGGEG